MKKIDLARQYCLTGTPSNALHKLNRYIRDVKGLKAPLIRHGYRSKDRSITPEQFHICDDFFLVP